MLRKGDNARRVSTITTTRRTQRRSENGDIAERQNRPSKGGMPRFVPTDDQRRFVSAMAGLMTWNEIASIVINPRTSKPISKETLQRAFADELKVATARRKSIIGHRFIELVEAGDPWAIKFGLRYICGWNNAPQPDAKGEDVPSVRMVIITSPTRSRLPNDCRSRRSRCLDSLPRRCGGPRRNNPRGSVPARALSDRADGDSDGGRVLAVG